MNCVDCGKEVKCVPKHDPKTISPVDDGDGGHLYSCGDCVAEGCGLGSTVHWCNDRFGLISNQPKIKITEKDIQKSLEALTVKA